MRNAFTFLRTKKADFVDSINGGKLMFENKWLTLDEASLPGPVREAFLPALEEFKGCILEGSWAG